MYSTQRRCRPLGGVLAPGAAKVFALGYDQTGPWPTRRAQPDQPRCSIQALRPERPALTHSRSSYVLQRGVPASPSRTGKGILSARMSR